MPNLQELWAQRKALEQECTFWHLLLSTMSKTLGRKSSSEDVFISSAELQALDSLLMSVSSMESVVSRISYIVAAIEGYMAEIDSWDFDDVDDYGEEEEDDGTGSD